MPFQSEAQRRFMWANHPDIARRWAKLGPNTDLPMHKDSTVNALAMGAKSSKSSPKPASSRARLGSGARFEALKNKLAGRKGVRNPAALAAAIGRKKYGASKMASMAAKGR